MRAYMPPIRNILILVAGAAYLGMGYVATTRPHPPVGAVLISLVPLGAAALASAWKSRVRLVLIPLYCVGALLLGLYFDTLRDHIAWLYFIQHAGAMTLLALTFGITLSGNPDQALCSRIADFIIPAPLDADYFRYTWKVTLAWTTYFAISAFTSIVLFFLAPITAWSVFANIVTPVSLAAMFAGEYLVRRRVIPGGPRLSIAATIKAYRAFSQQSNTR
ncbi:MAG: hypothetical protein M0T84_04215 [Betaproteobacteria bacterium]|nr:hypothetical protein [Betaproteobacteria bacterium]